MLCFRSTSIFRTGKPCPTRDSNSQPAGFKPACVCRCTSGAYAIPNHAMPRHALPYPNQPNRALPYLARPNLTEPLLDLSEIISKTVALANWATSGDADAWT